MFVQVRDIKKSYTKMGGGIFKSDKTLVLKGIDFDKIGRASCRERV